MRSFVTLVLTAVVLTITYAVAQQPVPEKAAALLPVELVPTSHPPLPADVSQYWFVPARGAVPDPAGNGFGSFSRGVRAIASGDYAAGLPLVTQATAGETRLADYARYYEAVALQGLSRLAEADAVLTALVAEKPEGYLGEASRLRLAEVLLARNEPMRAKDAIRAWLADSKAARDDAYMMLGEAEEALGHHEHASEAYRRVYFGLPLSPRVDEAKAGLDRMRGKGVAERPSLSEELARADRLFAGRRWADAKTAYESLITVVPPADRELMSVHLAECDFQLGRHRAARERLKPLLADSRHAAEARYYYLSATRKLGERSAYITQSRALVGDYPDSPWAAETLYDLASFFVVDDQDDEADRVFRMLLERFPRHRYAERAAWKVGWASYRARNFADTVKVFESAAAAFPRADYRPAWLYWSGRARDQLEDRAGAAARYHVVVTDYGSSYYGRLAARQLASRPVPIAAATSTAKAAPVAAAAPPTEPLMRALMTAGLFDEALNEVQFAQRAWGDSPQLQATAAWLRYQQAQSLRADERFAALRGAINTMRRAYPQFMSAAGQSLPVEVLRVIFPLDYWELIEKHSRASGLDPYLIAALMAQESTFTAEVRSRADARGLMQIMPPTGRRYARKLGMRSFTTASLNHPDTNVQIGARYFKDLVDQFGAVHYALAGYNAGEARVAEWLRESPGLPPDEFIDSIPFPETQNYVKRILGTADDYRRLYGGGLLAPNQRQRAALAD